MNTETSSTRPAIVPILILLGGFGLLLFILLISAPSVAQRIGVQNVGELGEILSLASGEPGYSLRHLALSPDGKQLLVTSGYRNEFWQLNNQTEQIMNLKQSGGFSPVVFFRNNKATAALMAPGANLSFIDIDSGTILQHFDRLSGRDYAHDWSLSPDGEWLVAKYNEASLFVTHIETGQQRLTIDAPQGYRFRNPSTAFSTDGKVLATSLMHGESLSFDFFLWDATTGVLLKKLGNFSAEEGYIGDIDFSHDGQRLAIGGNIIRNERIVSYIQVWDIPSSRVLGTWTGGSDSVSVSQVTFTPDGQHLVAEGSDQVWLWDVDEFVSSGTPLIYQTGNGSTPVTSAIALSPDGSLLASGASKGVALYEVKTGKLLTTLNAGHVKDLAFSGDGRLLVSGGNQVVRFWSIGGYNPYLPPVATVMPNALPTPIVKPTPTADVGH